MQLMTSDKFLTSVQECISPLIAFYLLFPFSHLYFPLPAISDTKTHHLLVSM